MHPNQLGIAFVFLSCILSRVEAIQTQLNISVYCVRACVITANIFDLATSVPSLPVDALI